MNGKKLRIYGQRAGSPGVLEDETLCVEEVFNPAGWGSHQCLRKRGDGPDGLYCKQHAKMRAGK